MAALLAILLFAARPWLLERAPDPLLQSAARWLPRDPHPHVVLGERLLARGETRAALRQFERAAALGSQDFRLAVALADAMRAAGLSEKAAAQAGGLLQVEPESGRLYRILGQCQLEQGRLSEGLASLERATRLAPHDEDAWIALAEAQIGIEGFRPETARVWEEGLKRNPGQDSLRFGLAETYVGLGRYEEAESLLHDLPEQPLPEHPKARELYARAWAARGAVLRRMRPDPARRAGAGQALERALTLAPHVPDTHYERALLQADAGEWEAARKSLETATRLRPYAHPFWYHLARVYRRLGLSKQADHAEARFDLLVSTFAAVNRDSRSLDAHPEDVPRRLRLARLLLDRWDWDAAALHLSLVLRDHPGHPEATRLMHRLHRQQKPAYGEEADISPRKREGSEGTKGSESTRRHGGTEFTEREQKEGAIADGIPFIGPLWPLSLSASVLIRLRAFAGRVGFPRRRRCCAEEGVPPPFAFSRRKKPAGRNRNWPPCPTLLPPALLLAAALLTGCDRSAGDAPPLSDSRPAGEITFQDMQPGSGLDFPLHYASGQEPGIKETIGYPAALLDADGDGRLDVLLAGPDRVALFRNLGEWKFQPVPEAGFRQNGYWQGVAVGDVDNDGRPDVYLSGFGCAALYLNQGGVWFRDVTAASGLANSDPNRWQTSAAFADVDRDGRLDLYVTCYVELGNKTGLCAYPGGITTACSPTEFAPQRGALYLNRDGARFVDATAAYGLDGAHGNGLGVAFADPNGDGYPDLYLANDQLPCDLYLNQRGRRFVNVGTRSGTAFGPDGAPQAGMGVDFGDYDVDGREDLVVTTYQREPTSLYRNDGSDLFTNAAYASHVGAATAGTVGWGVKWADFDNDGRLDLVIANGHPLHRIREIDPSTDARQPLQLFRNQGDGLFAELSAGDAARPIAGRALCAGDLDNDGKVDFLVSDIDGQPLLLRNTSPAPHHWLTVRLVGPPVTEGARITLRAGARQWTRRSTTGGSYLSASDPRVHVGLGDVSVLDEVQVQWPGGKQTVLKNVPSDRELVVKTGG